MILPFGPAHQRVVQAQRNGDNHFTGDDIIDELFVVHTRLVALIKKPVEEKAGNGTVAERPNRFLCKGISPVEAILLKEVRDSPLNGLLVCRRSVRVRNFQTVDGWNEVPSACVSLYAQVTASRLQLSLGGNGVSFSESIRGAPCSTYQLDCLGRRLLRGRLLLMALAKMFRPKSFNLLELTKVIVQHTPSQGHERELRTDLVKHGQVLRRN